MGGPLSVVEVCTSMLCVKNNPLDRWVGTLTPPYHKNLAYVMVGCGYSLWGILYGMDLFVGAILQMDIQKKLKTVPGLIANMYVHIFWSKNLPVTKSSSVPFFISKKNLKTVPGLVANMCVRWNGRLHMLHYWHSHRLPPHYFFIMVTILQTT